MRITPWRETPRRRSRWILFVALAIGAAAPSFAQYPERVIKAVVPFPAGGGTDIFARVVAERVGKVLGQPVVIENKGGAEGNIGMDMVAKSPADGYTILFNSSAATVNPAMYKSLPFDPLKDLQPVAVLCEYLNLFVVNTNEGAKRRHYRSSWICCGRTPASTTRRQAGRGSFTSCSGCSKTSTS